MPSVEKHVKFCVKEFGEENEELCYMVNSWMDAPSREFGARHRVLRHDIESAWQRLLYELGYCVVKLSPEDVERARDGSINIDEYGLKKYFPKVPLVLEMMIQHLKLDGLLTPRQIEELRSNPIKVKVIFDGDTGEAILFTSEKALREFEKLREVRAREIEKMSVSQSFIDMFLSEALKDGVMTKEESKKLLSGLLKDGAITKEEYKTLKKKYSID